MGSIGRGFFAIGSETFLKAIKLGINEAVCILVLARGTARDNVTTPWSANAVQSYTGMAWSRADNAIKRLEKSGIVARVPESSPSRPKRVLSLCGKRIWLPNTLVDSVGEERSPVRKIRETQCVDTLLLLVDLYNQQNLRDDGGLPQTVAYESYSRSKLGGRRAYTVWGFSADQKRKCFRLSVQSKYTDATDADLIRCWQTLESLGLVEWVPYLMEGKSGEPIHPLEDNDLMELATRAAEGMLSEGQTHRSDCYEIVVPVLNHLRNVQVRGIARLRYRPHTRMTKGWWSRYERQTLEFKRLYRELAGNGYVADMA